MAVYFFLAFGLLLMAAAAAHVLLRERHDVDGAALENAVAATVSGLNLQLPEDWVAARIFAAEDWEFVAARAPRRLRELRRARRALALAWLSEVQGEVAKVLDFHRFWVARCPDLNVRAEFRIGASYFAFISKILAAKASVRFIEPFRVQVLITSVSSGMKQVLRAVGQGHAGGDYDRLESSLAEWARK